MISNPKLTIIHDEIYLTRVGRVSQCYFSLSGLRSLCRDIRLGRFLHLSRRLYDQIHAEIYHTYVCQSVLFQLLRYQISDRVWEAYDMGNSF